MRRLDPPPDALRPFDHHPEAWAAFNRYYGTLWAGGIVDQPTKEIARLRNARITGCGICKNLRFAGARAAGLTEEHLQNLDDDALPPRWRLAVRLADALIDDPGSVEATLGDALAAEFTPAEIVELVATVTTAIAFSKAAVVFGAPPEMPVLEVPTPGSTGDDVSRAVR